MHKITKVQLIATILAALILLACACNLLPKHDAPQVGKEIVLRLEPGPGNPRNSEGDFVQLNDGRILFIFTHFTGGAGDHAKAFLAGRYSDTAGKSWSSEDFSVVANEGDMNVMSVSLLRLQDGRIALFYLRKNSETDCIPYVRFSNDEAKSWSKPIKCIDDPGYYVMNNDRAVQLPGGRILLPVALHSAPDYDWSAVGRIMCTYSDDAGASWSKSAEAPNPRGTVLQEPGIVELTGGDLMMFLRTNAGVQFLSFSKDRGEHWSAVQPSQIRSPLSPASIERIPATGDLLLVWNNNGEQGKDGGKRTPFNMAISKDDGASWQHIKTLESDPFGWYCYTAIEFVGDVVLLGHCAGDTRKVIGLATTQITRLSLDWLYKDATPPPVVSCDKNGLVKLSCADEKAVIYFTLDPSPSGTFFKEYRKPIHVSRTTTVRMQACKKEAPSSEIVTQSVGQDVYQEATDIEAELKPGLRYDYFEGAFRTAKDIKAHASVKSGLCDSFSIANKRRDDNFAFLFSGFIRIAKDGLYTFFLGSNDGSLMALDGKEFLNNDGAHGMRERSEATSLRAGMHKIDVAYFQLGGGSALEFYWTGPGFEKTEIEPEFLFHIEQVDP